MNALAQDLSAKRFQILKDELKCGVTSGMDYKNMTIVNDDCKWHHKLERHLWSSIMLLELSITLLESSIKLLENIYSTSITHADCHMMIIICL